MRFYEAILPAAMLIVGAGCNPGSKKAAEQPEAVSVAPKPSQLTKLVVTDTKVGTGPTAERGDSVWVQYTGKLANGTVFDTSKKGEDAQPFNLVLGEGKVIKGWDEGLVGMKVGGTRELKIPADLGYGSQASGKIPANSDLYFTVDLVDIWKAADKGTIVATDVKKGTGRAVKKGDTVLIDYDASTLGKLFETTKKIGRPQQIIVGQGQTAVVGFDDALVGMQVGGERIIKAPPEDTRMVGMDRLGMTVATYDVKLVSIK